MMPLIPAPIDAAFPFVANSFEKVSNHWNALSAPQPCELNAPVLLFRSLLLTAVEIAPGNPVSVWRCSKMRAVGFECCELLVFISVDIKNGHRRRKFSRRIHERCGYRDNSAYELRMARGE